MKRRTSSLEDATMGGRPRKPTRLQALAADSTQEDLPYAVERWTLSRTAGERVLGRANSAVLAHAIFTAAMNEHLGRRITLRKADQLLAQTAESIPRTRAA